MNRAIDFLLGSTMRWLLLALAVVFPLVTDNEYHIYVMALAFIWAIAVYGMNIITGYCGQLNLAHGGFFDLTIERLRRLQISLRREDNVCNTGAHADSRI